MAMRLRVVIVGIKPNLAWVESIFRTDSIEITWNTRSLPPAIIFLDEGNVKFRVSVPEWKLHVYCN